MSFQDILTQLGSIRSSIDELSEQVTALQELKNPIIGLMAEVVPGESTVVDNEIKEVANLIIYYVTTMRNVNDALADVLGATNTDQPYSLVVEPNWYQLAAQFQSFLATRGTWTDTYAGGIGQTISELVASSTMMLLNGIGVAQIESFSSIARRSSSVYAGMEMMGVRIPRKTPAAVETTLTQTVLEQIVFNNIQLISSEFIVEDAGTPVDLVQEWVTVTKDGTTLEYGTGVGKYSISGSIITFDESAIGLFFSITVNFIPDTLEIPKYSLFSVAGNKFFNREPIIFQPNQETISHTLYEGEPKTYEETAVTTGFQVIKLPETDFTVSEKDVLVRTIENGVTTNWSLAEVGLWDSGNIKVYVDRTTGLGAAEVIIGNGTYGAKPLQGDVIYVDYVVCSGSVANRNDIGLRVTGVDYPTLRGTSTSKVSSGVDEKSVDVYRVVGTDILDSRSTIIRHKDYVAHVLNWPNVADVVIKAQKDIAPNDMRWMNTLRFCILPTTSERFSDNEWTDLTNYLDDNAHTALMWVRADPVALNININLTIYIFDYVVAQEVKEPIRNAVSAVFNRVPGTLGKTVSISDVIVAAKVSGVDWIEITINGDSRDIQMPDAYTYAVLTNIDLNIAISQRV